MVLPGIFGGRGRGEEESPGRFAGVLASVASSSLPPIFWGKYQYTFHILVFLSFWEQGWHSGDTCSARRPPMGPRSILDSWPYMG